MIEVRGVLYTYSLAQVQNAHLDLVHSRKFETCSLDLLEMLNVAVEFPFVRCATREAMLMAGSLVRYTDVT